MITFDHGGRRWAAEWFLNEASTSFVLRVNPAQKYPLPEKEDVQRARAYAQTAGLVPKPTGAVEPKEMATGYYRVRQGDHWLVARWLPQGNCWRPCDDQKLPPGSWDEIGAKVA